MIGYNRTVTLGLTLILAWQGGFLWGADWPAYRADARRSGISTEQLTFPLSRTWLYRPAQTPRPAWPEPGKELHRMDFDYAFQPVAAADLVFFGSSADDTVRALSAGTGVLKWSFTTGGPVRFAPAVAGGKVYVASDDGILYCLDAADGGEIWRFRAAPQDEQLLGNGRMISRWPLRTGVLVADGVAYLTAGMWPAEGICVYALEAETGKQLWCNRDAGSMYIDLPHPTSSAFTGICPQGYLAASPDTLLVPTGRSVPAAFDRRTGSLRYYLPSKSWMHGGCGLTVASDLFFNPQHGHQEDDEAFVGEAAPKPGDGMASYALRDGVQEKSWALPGCLQMAATEDVLYAAGEGFVQALDLKAWRQGKKLEECILWKVEQARPYSLILAGKTLLTGTKDALTAIEAASGKKLWREEFGEQVRGLVVANGRLFAAGQSGILACFEHCAVPSPAAQLREKPAWEVPLTGQLMKTAAGIVHGTGVTKGYAVVFGEDDSRLAAALALQTGLHVICVLKGPAAAVAERRRISDTGLYGSRVVVQGLDDFSHLPYASYFADLVVVTGGTASLSGEELYRILHPAGGVLCLAGDARTASERLVGEARIPPGEVRATPELFMVTRGALAGGGEWRWELGDAGRSGVNDDRLVRLPAEMLWFGGPGPNRMMDRHWHTATPLCVAGRVFVKGQHHLLAFDAYNGRELWSIEVRGAGREKGWWAVGSFTADDESLYAAVGDACLRLDQTTGKTMAVYRLPKEVREEAKPEPPQIDVDWSTTWQVIGPLAKGAPALPRETLRTMPGEVTAGGKKYTPVALEAVEGGLDFSYLYGGYGFKPLSAGEKAGPYRGGGTKDMADSERVAYAFTKIKCPQAGRLTIGAGADWWMQWFIDGAPIYDTLEEGNGAYPYNAFNHVFSTEVSAGEHVLCVMVKSGSLSWCLIYGGGAKFARQIPPVPEEQQPPLWGWVGVVDDLLLGIRFTPDGTGKVLFTLGKDDGRLRWAYQAKRGLSGDCVAIGDGRIYLTDETLWADASAAKKRGEKLKPERTLLALNLNNGAELWRQEEKAPNPLFWPPRMVQYARGVVVLDGAAAFDALHGTNLWRKTVIPEKHPVIHNDWVIDWPRAFALRTGEALEAEDVLGRGKRPLRFPRAYGCGDVAGCDNLLLFRSGMIGAYDFTEEGTTTFGGVKPNCSINVIPAAGLLLCPEGSSGCSCSYNFQTSLALAPTAKHHDVWYSFYGEKSTAPLTRLCLNFGAPGDRRDSSGCPWLGWPRPAMPGTCAVPAGIVAGRLIPWHHAGETAAAKNTGQPWIYSSGLKGAGQFTVLLRNLGAVVFEKCEHAPVIDGRLDDPCWQAVKPVHFDNLSNLLEPQSELRVCRDAEKLYFAFRRKAALRDGHPLPFVAAQTSDEADCRRDDECELFLTDAAQKTGLVLGVSCAGGRSAVLKELGQERETDGSKWHGQWSCAVEKKEQEWTAEIALPLQALADAHLAADSLRFNFMSQNLSGAGPGKVYLVDPGLNGFDSSTVFSPIVYQPLKEPGRRYTIRLHFSETEELKPGERVFNVELQGRRVLENLDVVREAGAPKTALVKEFKGIEIGEAFTLSLLPPDKDARLEPLICGLEVLLE